MFQGLSQVASLLKNAHAMQGRMQEMQESLRNLRVTGTAANGLISVEVSGQLEVMACRIDPALLSPVANPALGEWIVAATNEALQNAKLNAAQKMQEITGGMNIPGLSENLGKMGLS